MIITIAAMATVLPIAEARAADIRGEDPLTAFAASAGSAFWHDRLDKLQASKKGAQAAATLLNQASQVAETVNIK